MPGVSLNQSWKGREVTEHLPLCSISHTYLNFTFFFVPCRQSRPFVTQQDQGTRIPQGQGDWKSVRVDRWNGEQVALLPELLTPELPLAHICKLNKSQISVVF